ncbi:MAG: formate dehydrogenase accessory sulfurtransferase FdhD [Proteobacteria bacterium]|nr:formate dehydrogenase accessory sulfurtransferase FdhD [Pseudomonadota bacterium]
MNARSLEINVSKISGAAEQSLSDRVAIEEPLEIRLGYSTSDGRTATSISITMRTPGHDAELATGFLFSESIIKRLQDVESVQPCGPPAPDSGNHNVVRVELASAVQVDLGRLRIFLSLLQLTVQNSGRAANLKQLLLQQRDELLKIGLRFLDNHGFVGFAEHQQEYDRTESTTDAVKK